MRSGKRRYHQATSEELAAAERRLGVTLPAAYKSLLAGGTLPVSANGPIDTPRDIGTAYLTDFLGLTEGPADLVTEAHEYWDEGYVPRDALPIAREAGGNLVCLIVAPNGAGRPIGSVWFWDHDTIEEQRPGELYRLAATIEEFMGLVDVS